MNSKETLFRLFVTGTLGLGLPGCGPMATPPSTAGQENTRPVPDYWHNPNSPFSQKAQELYTSGEIYDHYCLLVENNCQFREKEFAPLLKSVVALSYQSAPDQPFEPLCTATLIWASPDGLYGYFLTAAHCFPEENLSQTGFTCREFQGTLAYSKPEHSSSETIAQKDPLIALIRITADEALLRLPLSPSLPLKPAAWEEKHAFPEDSDIYHLIGYPGYDLAHYCPPGKTDLTNPCLIGLALLRNPLINSLSCENRPNQQSSDPTDATQVCFFQSDQGPGGSGSPVFSPEGKLIALVVSGNNQVPVFDGQTETSLTGASPLKNVRHLLESLQSIPYSAP